VGLPSQRLASLPAPVTPRRPPRVPLNLVLVSKALVIPATSCLTKSCIYVANFAGGASDLGSVTVYAKRANGNAAPIQTITSSNTGLNIPFGVAIRAR
jgi:hypothetical protein